MARSIPDIKKILKAWDERRAAYEAIDKLRQGLFEDYKRRQTYEWKMCFAIWTFVVGFIAFIITNPTIPISSAIMALVAVVILSIHVYWQKNLERANDHDRKKVFECEKVMYELLEIEPWGKPYGHKKGWSHRIYVLITLVLLCFAFFVVKNRVNKIVMLNDVNYNKLDYSETINAKKRNELVNKVMKNYFDSKQNSKK